MITLAQSGVRHAGPKTPTSPIALSRVRTRVSRRGRRWIWPSVAAGIAVLGFALWRVAPWRQFGPATVPPPAVVRDSVPVAAVPPPQPAPLPAPRRNVGGQRDDSLIGALRAGALKSGQRAALAGASAADLSGGQAAFEGAESLVRARRVSEAMMQFATAASLWTDAERAARSRSARDTEARRVAESPPPAPPPAPAPQPAAPPPAPVAADPRPDIEKVIADYAGALESRDIEQVRHAYPGLTGAQQGSWQTFFDRVRNLKANLAIANLNIAGASADATVSGVYEYDNASTGRAERRPVTFRVTLARDANGWRISAIR